MINTNGKKTVSLVIYIITLVIAVIINAVAITAAIMSRPTEEKVKVMINEQFQEQSYLGQKLVNIEKQIDELKKEVQKLK